MVCQTLMQLKNIKQMTSSLPLKFHLLKMFLNSYENKKAEGKPTKLFAISS